MRRIVTFVLAALLSIAGTVGITATPALATAGACGFAGDVAGTVYYQSDFVSGTGKVFDDNFTGGTSYLVAAEQSYRYTSVPGDGLTPGHCYIEVATYGSNVDGIEGDIQIGMTVYANANGMCDQQVISTKLPVVHSAASTTGNSGWLDVSGCGTHMSADVNTIMWANWFNPSPAPVADVDTIPGGCVGAGCGGGGGLSPVGG